MRRMFIIIVLLLLSGCGSELLRPKGQPFKGFSCAESVLHFYSYCETNPITKDFLDNKTKECEERLQSKICDKELAALLWCMGRVSPGAYYVTGASGGGVTLSGCDCSTFNGEYKKCRIKNGIYDK